MAKSREQVVKALRTELDGVEEQIAKLEARKEAILNVMAVARLASGQGRAVLPKPMVFKLISGGRLNKATSSSHSFDNTSTPSYAGIALVPQLISQPPVACSMPMVG